MVSKISSDHPLQVAISGSLDACRSGFACVGGLVWRQRCRTSRAHGAQPSSDEGGGDLLGGLGGLLDKLQKGGEV